MPTATRSRRKPTNAPPTLQEFRARFKRHRDACLFVVVRADFDAALDRAIHRFQFDRAEMTPAQWVAAIEAILLPCERCKGTGDYCWGGTINGRPVHKATCYHCGGAGQQTLEDAYRNRSYMKYWICSSAS